MAQIYNGANDASSPRLSNQVNGLNRRSQRRMTSGDNQNELIKLNRKLNQQLQNVTTVKR